MLVPEDRKAEVLEAVSAAYGSLKVGAPTDPTVAMGPVISAAQREKCEQYVQLAEDHGGKVFSGGRRPEGLDRGYYFEPTVLDLPNNANPAAQEEIFGPVIGVLGYRDLDDAVAIANDSPYGLSAQVYGADVAAAVASAAGCAPARSTSTPPSSARMRRVVVTSRAAWAANGVPTGSANFRKSNIWRLESWHDEQTETRRQRHTTWTG